MKTEDGSRLKKEVKMLKGKGGCREKTKNMRLKEKTEEGITSRLKWRAEVGKFT
jgi:hypothetical protein